MWFLHTSPFAARSLVSERIEQGEQSFPAQRGRGGFLGRGLGTRTHREEQRVVSVPLGSYSRWVFPEGQVPQKSSGW